MKLDTLTLVVVLLLSTNSLVAQQDSLQFYFNKAREQYGNKNYNEFYKNIMKAHKLHPYHQGILYQSGLAAALVNKKEESIKMLRKAINIRTTYDLGAPDLESLKEESGFMALKTYREELSKKIIHSDTAFTLKDRTLHIETLTAGEENGVFYLGSIHQRKILKRDKDGQVHDFTASGQDGLAGVFGLKVDQKKKILWACSSPVPEMEGYDSTFKSALFKYDITTGKLVNKYLPNRPEKEFVFGDVALDKKGQAYVSDSKNNLILITDEVTKNLELFFTSSEFWNIQGMVFSPDQRFLFISDYIKGIFRLTMATKELVLLPVDFELSLKSTDGLLFRDNSLICIQNQVVPMRVVRVFLDKEMGRLTRLEVIDRGHPGFDEPTNGCMVGNQLYYVANSQWSGYNDGKIKSPDLLKDILVLKYKF